MQRTPVTGSSNIKSAGHDPALNLMEVEFNDGKIYLVETVNPDQFETFMASHSKGSWYHRYVRAAGLPVRLKIEEKEIH